MSKSAVVVAQFETKHQVIYFFVENRFKQVYNNIKCVFKKEIQNVIYMLPKMHNMPESTQVAR